MISVDGLVSIRSLGLSYLAGAPGGHRLVTWAHACDLPDPWRWCKPGDMVMTTGGGLPDQPQQQGEWVAQLIESQVSALVIAPRPGSPGVSDRVLEVADESHFPVLSASFDLEFVTLARTVIESAIQTERERLASVKRLYDVYWEALRSRASFAQRLRLLEQVVGWQLQVLDKETRETLASSQDTDTKASTCRSGLPAAVEHPDSDAVIAIPARREALLVARPSRKPVLDRALLQHLGGLITLELEQQAAERDRLRAAGADLLSGLLDGNIELAAVWPELHHRGLDDNLVVACWGTRGMTELDHDNLHHHVRLHRVAPLLLCRSGVLFGIVPDSKQLLDVLAQQLSITCAVGISARLSRSNGVVEAARQAQLALARAHEGDSRLFAYGDMGSETGLLPRSVEESRQLVRRVLGPVIDYDRKHGTDLTGSLRAFLRNDRSWQLTASQLGIHRQTLVYRLRKAEQLTGFKPTSTVGTAALWLALEAADLVHLPLHETAEDQ